MFDLIVNFYDDLLLHRLAKWIFGPASPWKSRPLYQRVLSHTLSVFIAVGLAYGVLWTVALVAGRVR